MSPSHENDVRVFTDADLNTLKISTDVQDYLKSTGFDIKALIARLERSEAERDALKIRLEAADELAKAVTAYVKELDLESSGAMLKALAAYKKARGKP